MTFDMKLEELLEQISNQPKQTKYDWNAVLLFIGKQQVVRMQEVRDFLGLPRTKSNMVYRWLENNCAAEIKLPEKLVTWYDREKPLLRIVSEQRVFYGHISSAQRVE